MTLLLILMLAQAPVQEVLADVRVHGNHTTPDADVLAIAGLNVGQAVGPATGDEAAQRLKKSGRFDGVEVRKRYTSLTDASAVAFVIIVDEKPAPMALPGPPVLRPIRALRGNSMFLPILDYADGYGFSYGLRTSFVRPFGERSRITVPLTWGAWRRAAIEADKRFTRGPLSRVSAGASIGRREHPRFDVADLRQEAWARAERALPLGLRVGGSVGWSDVSFGGPAAGGGAAPAFDLDERMTSAGIDLTLDTRIDPTFPRNAVYARAAWERLAFDARDDVARVTLDARGYLGLRGSSVVAVRAWHGRASGPLPPYEQWLLGGATSLRGFRAGSFIGDRATTTSAEVRVPLSSPLSVGKLGLAVFADVGKAWRFDQPMREVRWERGGGAGVFVVATVFQLRLDVARGSGGDTRVHFRTGLTF